MDVGNNCLSASNVIPDLGNGGESIRDFMTNF